MFPRFELKGGGKEGGNLGSVILRGIYELLKSTHITLNSLIIIYVSTDAALGYNMYNVLYI